MSSTQEVGDIFGEGPGPSNAMLRSPTVLIVAVGLWGMNLFFFKLFAIPYKYVFEYDLLVMRKKAKEQQRHSNADTRAASTAGSSLDGDDMLLNEDSTEDEKAQLVEVSTSTEGASITWLKLVVLSFILLGLLHSTTKLWMLVVHRGVVGAVLFFYASCLIYIFIPLGTNKWLRKAFYMTLKRIGALLVPRCWCLRGSHVVPKPIPFIDVFVADAMCSLSKVFFDWGILIHMASHFPEPVPQEAHNIIIPSFFAAIPFFIRARQCLLMLSIGTMRQDPKRYQHLANAVKYATSIFPLVLSAYQKTMLDPKIAISWNKYLYLLQTINALYALYWDIVMDWGMMQNPQAVVAQACFVATPFQTGNIKSKNMLESEMAATGADVNHEDMAPSWRNSKCHHLLLRPRLRFGLTLSALILVTDSVLRFSWLLKFVSHKLFTNSDAFVLCTQFLEIFRRSIWNLLRVEWEHIKQQQSTVKRVKARDSLSDHDEDQYDLTLLDQETDGNSFVEQEMDILVPNSSTSY